MVRVVSCVFASFAVMLTACGGSTEPLSDGPSGPCDPFGTWKITYELADPPDAYIPGNPAGEDTLIITKGEDGGAATAEIQGGPPDEFALSAEQCHIHVVANRSWTQGGEPWSDERALELDIAGDTASGTLKYGCYWNCGGMHGTLDMVASATRTAK